ncbi:MAG: aldehyde ferredoxin oxidoreductase family protein [Candidatus Bathyarchaeota archaeon]|nr:MAG: aldehyde ferredoxin oxidoreductase family protein [Candidatus Bathyarchaeota archaeon]
MKGYAGKILRVNLSNNSVKIEPLPSEWPRKFLGGIGFASIMLFNETKKDQDALNAENKLIIAPGLLTGTGIPTASKTLFITKSPLTDGFGKASAGASIGPSLKKAGYDILVIEGASPKPVILVVNNQQVELNDAEELWGKNVRETASLLKKHYEGYSTAVIGPAGENLSKIAGIDSNERQAARTGVGAVMGAKKLKAIAVKGTLKVEYANPEALHDLVIKWTKSIRESPDSQLDMKYGTAEFYAWVNKDKGVHPSRNWQQGYFQKSFDNQTKEGEPTQLDPYYWSPKYTVRNKPCPNCTKPCGRIIRITEGKYSGTELDGPEYETIYSLGANLDIDNFEALSHIHMMCDLYGLDAISAGLTVSWAMEAFEKGLLTSDDLDGLSLRFGDIDGTLEILRRMAYREGKVGALLSDGVKKASEKLGKGSSKFAIHSKGLELPAYDVRGIKGMGLAMAVAVRGGDHLTAVVYGTELVGKWWKFSGIDRFSAENKGYEVKAHEDLMILYDIVGVCKFTRHMFFAKAYPEMVKAVTGMDMSVADLFTIGERVNNLQRAFNVREGLARNADSLPERVFENPIPKGVSKGCRIKRSEFERMLDDYYQARGWSWNGIPTKTKLISLDLFKASKEVGV